MISIRFMARSNLTAAAISRRRLSRQDGVYGAVADPILLGRLDIKPGDKVKIGTSEFVMRGIDRQ